MNKQEFLDKYGFQSASLVLDAAKNDANKAGYSKLRDLLAELSTDLESMLRND